MHMNRTLPPEFLAELEGALGAEILVADTDEIRAYGTDWTRVYDANPGGVVLPRSTFEVSKILQLCTRHRIAVVPSGGRTGLASGAVAAHGELVLSLARMAKMGPVDPVAGSVEVEAGAITESVHRHADAAGWCWPIDLAAKGSSQVGGNLATNAGGLRVIRYGATRKWVLGITCVLMDGRILHLGGLEKDNTGYDLKQLLIGSEGTLAVITAATLKLAPKPKPTRVLLLALESPEMALSILSHVRTRGENIMAYELWTEACLQEVEAAKLGRTPFSASAPYYALLELEDDHLPDSLDALLQELWESGWLIDAVMSSSRSQMRELWSLREHITLSLSRREMMHKSDIAVPVGKVAQLIASLTNLFAREHHELELFLFGHVGDGNVHVNVAKPVSWDKDQFLQRIDIIDAEIGTLLQQLGGSVSAEHGIGLLKKKQLHFTRSADELTLFRAIKKAFDPLGLLNPGKLIDP